MKKAWLLALLTAGLTLQAGAADKGTQSVANLRASLNGVSEVPPIATRATGSFSATSNGDGTYSFKLTYSGLAANPTVGHIHFGLSKEAGGVMIFLCGGGNQPACPEATSATITGTFSLANVVGPTGQGVPVGDLTTAIQQVA